MTNFSQADMHGKIVMVTGATDGIGKVTARELARMDANVIVVGRNRAKCEAAVVEIRAQTGNASVEFLLADLSSQREVRVLVEQFKQRYAQLHVLVNNAGAFYLDRRASADGIELTFALNHLGYFLLTQLLLDVIAASAPARIVNVSSGLHYRAHMNFDDLEAKRRYAGLNVYAQSKLANVLFTYELARRLEGTGVTANVLHPGLVASQFGLNNGPRLLAWRWFTRWRGISPSDGAQTSIYLASSPAVASMSGKYFDRCRALRSSDESYDVSIARRLWDVSVQMTRLRQSAQLREQERA